ncbi:hypothetical protein [Lentilactobacillus sp. SPB1-3]|uniref:Uncharacterized protein n=1 Tax=Lentilactobacillus terminaliae TaxID=3003483 RepID=A0ACD5DEA8_9LACO|nr:hypothetical protein [Lentilactobacillus sp. SPB1-3]MCZ0977999.1 hypothetical protein [Lentilactobacillus sp. SPB1-3]
MDQKDFNQMIIESLKDESIRLEIESICQNVRKSRDSGAIKQFRQDVTNWTGLKETSAVSKTAIQNGLYGAIRLKIGIKSMNSLTDDLLPEAQRAFEQFKSDFDV